MAEIEEGAELGPRVERQLICNSELLLELYETYAATRPPRTNAETLALAFLSRAQYGVRTILGLLPRPFDCIPVARCVYEHVVAFAWLAIDLEAHHRMFLRWELNERKKMLKAVAAFRADAPPIELLELGLIEAGPVAAPETYDRAVKADEYWCAQPLNWQWRFLRSYANFFRYCSAFVHPTAMGIESFLERTDSDPFVLSTPRPSVDTKNAVLGAVASLADGLVVASVRFGWPPFEAVDAAWRRDIVVAGGETDA